MTKLIKEIMLVARRHQPGLAFGGHTNYRVVAQHPDGTSTEVDIPEAAGKILEKHPMLLVANSVSTPEAPNEVPDFELTPLYKTFLNVELPKRLLDGKEDWLV